MTLEDDKDLEIFSETTPLLEPDDYDPDDPLLDSDAEADTAPPPSPKNGIVIPDEDEDEEE